MRKEDLFRLIDATSDEDDAGFQMIIRILLDEGFVSERELARMVDVSIPTVSRWRDGITRPHPLMRKHLWKCIKEHLR
ncbi:MAG: winged helix-turn-helix domain-containing protein [Patescibacteria group bacterium]|nr:winged helix-turn-helix domain-containing protein [Patescibacteria group bacterium]